ncbi:ribose-phosphate diphosphokinase [Pseudalkalibacillus caeni]|uniref:Putative ribose-phosphate pyrophosphokinase n=1 Tax=Exobacillus caeni TaxID=2574798 RepID=A0A5R9F600_9BACL|nr:ribose-phosphate pyrophosphokinase [Pseudalkalibacillus caeni]TLS38451.1 ribose-phosphate pyrophosphokinase [Pseudalkalibacillus caeni]
MGNFDSKVRVFTLNSNPELTEEIVSYLGLEMGDSSVKRFSDGEVHLNIEESVRGYDTYLVQSLGRNGNEYIMELLIMIDAMIRASAKTINVVLPYYGYARQDRKKGARQPITAKLIANLLEEAGATRVITVDLHAAQIEGFFNIPVDQLTGIPILADYIAEKALDDVVVVAPDNSSVLRARKLANRLNMPIAFIDRRSYEIHDPEKLSIIGNVEGKTAVIIDDMVDTAINVVLTADVLKAHGAKDIYACFTHAVLSDGAVNRITESIIKEVVVTNTIPLLEEMKTEKMTVLSIAPMLGEAIKRVQNQQSISRMLD